MRVEREKGREHTGKEETCSGRIEYQFCGFKGSKLDLLANFSKN
jgi:hypothetical protein